MRKIAIDTRARWGYEQAAAYSAALRDAIKSLGEFPFRFPEFESPHKGLRRMGSGRHTVFYLITEDTIEIVRVLHTAMDFDERLG
jgi:toxin ParE1/3/4